MAMINNDFDRARVTSLVDSNVTVDSVCVQENQGEMVLEIPSWATPAVASGISVGPGAILKGWGTIAENVTNDGGTVTAGALGAHSHNVAPEQGTGVLAVQGIFSQSFSGTLQLEIDGAAPGTEYDQLVANSLRLGGNLEISLVDGFVLSPGDPFDLLKADSTRGNFTSIKLPVGIDWDTSNLLSDGRLFVANPMILDGDYNDTNEVNVYDLNLILFNWGMYEANLSST